MSHHIDSEEAARDSRLDLGDVYVFEGEARASTVLILTVNPFAGAHDETTGSLRPTTFHPECVYEFKIDTDSDFIEDISYRITFSEPDTGDAQTFELRRMMGDQARSGRDGQIIAAGQTGAPSALIGGGLIWAGLAADPFFSNGEGFGRFVDALAIENRFDPSAFDNPVSFAHNQNIDAIVIELPNAAFQTEVVRVWAVTTLWHHGQHLQVNREAHPLMLHLFLQDERLKLAHNQGHPASDVQRNHGAVAEWVAHATRLAQSSTNPQAYGEAVAQQLLPDVLTYRLSTVAGYGVAECNGRQLSDDVLDVLLSVFVNRPISDQIESEGRYQSTFPYLVAPVNATQRSGASDV